MHQDVALEFITFLTTGRLGLLNPYLSRSAMLDILGTAHHTHHQFLRAATSPKWLYMYTYECLEVSFLEDEFNLFVVQYWANNVDCLLERVGVHWYTEVQKMSFIDLQKLLHQHNVEAVKVIEEDYLYDDQSAMVMIEISGAQIQFDGRGIVKKIVFPKEKGARLSSLKYEPV